MGWKPWELRQLEHPREFLECIRGYDWQWSRMLDCAAFIAYHSLVAAGAGKKKDGEPLLISDLVGRDVFPPLVPPVEETELQQLEREAEETERRARAERAKLQIWAAQKAKEMKDRGEDPSGFLNNG